MFVIASRLPFRVAKPLVKVKQVIRRNLEEHAKRPDVLHVRRVFVALKMLHFSLCHVDRVAKFSLRHIHILSKCSDFFSKYSLHSITLITLA